MEALQTNAVPFRWEGDWAKGHLLMLDQRMLPGEEVWIPMTTAAQVAAGITDMVTRGAPAIGIAAAYGVAFGVREAGADFPASGQPVDDLIHLLENTRPTAVNLFWALRRMRALLLELSGVDHAQRVTRLFEEAKAIMDEDCANNMAMGRFGAELMPAGARILTHCNAGALATGGYGTAVGVIRATHDAKKLAHVWVDETRPYLQGARLTAWECVQDKLPATLITDSMAGHFMQLGEVDAVVVGTDRVAANGDVANKIGTYTLAVLCKYHGIPFYVAAPISTLDPDTASGADIKIEQRSAHEVTHIKGVAIAPDTVGVAHPAFDVTPAELVTAIITEKGVARAPYAESLAALTS